jgi:hypothetical protein
MQTCDWCEIQTNAAASLTIPDDDEETEWYLCPDCCDAILDTLASDDITKKSKRQRIDRARGGTHRLIGGPMDGLDIEVRGQTLSATVGGLTHVYTEGRFVHSVTIGGNVVASSEEESNKLVDIFREDDLRYREKERQRQMDYLKRTNDAASQRLQDRQLLQRDPSWGYEQRRAESYLQWEENRRRDKEAAAPDNSKQRDNGEQQ